MKTPKEKLKEIYDEYLSWKENNKGKHFYQYLASNKYTLAFTVLKIQKNLTEECGFSTTSECRKAINELENPNKYLEDSLNAIDKVIKENPKKVRKIVKRIKEKYNILSDSKTEKVVIYSAELENRDENTHIITWTGSNGYGQLTFKWVDNRYVLDSEMLGFNTIVKIIQKLQDI